jgi:glycosyltransferase involved in cell wall biosynthesis
MSPRWEEPFGLAGLEALAMGVPVAAWDSGAVAEWHSGPLAAWGDVEGLAAALREAIARRAQAPSGFEREPLMDRLVAIYERVTAAAALAAQ